MTKSLRRLTRLGNGLLVLLSLITAGYCSTPVAISPWFKQQLFDSSGRTLSFGCVFTYVSGTTTPLASFTDGTGTTQNSNPVILDAGGFLGTGGNGLWLQAGTAYTIKVKAAGGVKCASGSTLYTVDAIGGGLTVLTTNVTYSATPAFPIQAQNQLFKITLTGDAVAQPLTAVGILPPAIVAFEITQDGSGGHSFTWPSNSVGGSSIGQTANQASTQTFYWDGSVAQPIGPLLAGQVPALSRDLLNWKGDINAAGDATITGIITGATYRSACTPRATVGTFQLCQTDTILWRNGSNNEGLGMDTSDRLTVSSLGGILLTGTSPNILFGNTSASFPMLKRNSTALNLRLADDSADAGLTLSTLGASGVITSSSATFDMLGNEVSTPGSPPASGKQQLYPKAGLGFCSQDSSSVERCMPKATIATMQVINATGPYTCASGDQNVCKFTLTWPTAWADTNYTAVCNPIGPDNTSGSAALSNGGEGNLTNTTIDVYSVVSGSAGQSFAKWACYGVHN